MLPKHHKTSYFLKTGLFDNLSNFAELEKRISDLPTPDEEGVILVNELVDDVQKQWNKEEEDARTKRKKKCNKRESCRDPV